MITPVVLVCNDEYWLPYALEASKGFFSRYVIYDVGSTDRTRDIITWFMDTNKQATYYVRMLPMVAPSVQGCFRNSMIAEALTEYYFILDGDEVYTPKGYEALLRGAEQVHEKGKLYGIVERMEVDGDLTHRYNRKVRVPHHRVYHRNAVWTGNHPGEVPYFKQEERHELWIEDAICYHFHNAERSSKDAEVPKRLERRARPTYRPGDKVPFNLIETLPILKYPISGFPVCANLAAMQSDQV